MATRLLPALLPILLGVTSCAQAYEVHTIQSPDGIAAFELRYFNPGDGPYNPDPDEPGPEEYSSWSWEPHLIQQINQGVSYWASLVHPQGTAPAIINIGTDLDVGDAFALTEFGLDGNSPKTLVQMQLQGVPLGPDDLALDRHAVFGLGPSDFPQETAFSQIPLGGKDELVSTAIHELGHSFGVASFIDDIDDDEYKPVFGSTIGGWGPLMVDDNGRHASPGQTVLCAVCTNPYDPDAFDVRQDNGLLMGENIDAVLAGGLPGVPLSMLATSPYGKVIDIDDNNMSHIELKNSIMSHQSYRNYTGFMEAELAVLQDLGYVIDRANFYGRSIYGSGLSVLNTQGFSARNSEGNAYLPGQYNTAVLGLGLHVYGSDNHIWQAADLLTAGDGGAGIRVDGEHNHLVIAPGTRIYADGNTGQGIMFAYGKNHSVVQRGDVQALGQNGVGLRFDFGHNALMDSESSRGSYIFTQDDDTYPLLPELDGPLVTQADITGRVAGSQAAIHMSANAYVQRLNLMQGADIQGDIVSLYAEDDITGQRRITTLSLGQQADEHGRATGQADDRFRFSYADTIRGGSNLALSFDGGVSQLNGTHQVWGATVGSQGLLAGNANYQITGDVPFVNHGVISPGNSVGRIGIQGDYTQTASGTFLAEFNSAGQSDVLAVSGTAQLAGSLGLVPLAGWYDTGWDAAIWPVQAGHVSRGFDQVNVAGVSPTLSFDTADMGAGRYRLGMTRAENAYSQYGSNDNDWRAGKALWQLAAVGPSDSRAMLAGLDFSSPNGQDVAQALPQLSPAGYSAALAASLRRDRLAMDTALRGSADMRVRESGWTGYAALFGGVGRQDAQSSLVASRDTLYGVVAGGSRWLDTAPDVLLGFSLDVSEQKTDLKSPWMGRGKTNALGLGGQWRYQPDPWSGLYALGGIRAGVERGHLTRNLKFATYSASHDSSWTGYQASAALSGGYQFELSESASAGPFVSLDYAWLTRPAVAESGPQATRLLLDSQHTDALRSRLGLTAKASWDLTDGSTLSAHARASWDHEWRARNVRQSAHFAAQPAVSFDSVNDLLPRNMLGLRTGLSWQRSERLSVGLDLGAQVGGGYRAIDGQLTVRWMF